ncbi:MAG: hypothetical protein KAX49_19510 [Halanaerobiales bacterium]|nr:hypothetical protein [Halanaerobiales bacterium]
MTDQIYHQVQYPLKKAINLLKKVDLDGDSLPPIQLSESDIQEIREFLTVWEQDRARIREFVGELRQFSRTLF